MSIKITIQNGNIRLGALPILDKELKKGAQNYVERYQARMGIGIGVDQGSLYHLRTIPNANWIARLKGHSQPLKHTGGMRKAVRVNGAESNDKQAVIDFAPNSARGGVNGAKSDTYDRVASRMQSGAAVKDATLFFDNRGSSTEIKVKKMNIPARPHFFTAEQDRPHMVDPVFDRLVGWVRSEMIKT